MDVQLYVYDLSRGLARQMSRQFLGTQIDAIYHTSLVFSGIEYFFGQGIQTCAAGTTHHGQPMEIIPLGQSSLPEEVILEYLEDLREVYSAESYDLFAHNCNNFTNDFAMFLVGKGIPDHITSLPKKVLDTPFGQMLRPQIDQAMRPITQASTPATSFGSRTNGTIPASQSSRSTRPGQVHNITTQTELDRLLTEAKSSCAVIFFTSSTCTPCRIVYPTYDELAAEVGSKATLIKVDINSAYSIGAKYSIRATPTFISFLKGKQDNQWSGANPSELRGNVRMLVLSAFPPHPHQSLKMPIFLRSSRQPILYTKVPPLDKVIAKMGSEFSSTPAVEAAVTFIKARNTPETPSQSMPLPDLHALGIQLRSAPSRLALDDLFTAYDLFRLVLVDRRASGFFVEEASLSTIISLIEHVNQLPECPYNLRLVCLHVACNIFSTPLVTSSVLPSHPSLAALLVTLVSSSLLDTQHSHIRVAATSLALNLATGEWLTSLDVNDGSIIASANRKGVIPTEQKVELIASLLETLSNENESLETVRGLTLALLALGRLVYGTDKYSEVSDLCRAMDAKTIVSSKKKLKDLGNEHVALLKEIADELLSKGI